MNLPSKIVSIVFDDGASNAFSIFSAMDFNAPVVVLFPAMGVSASYYRHFAAYLSERNVHVVTVDHRGHGHSSLRPSRKVNFGYKEQIETEYIQIVMAVRKEFHASKIVVMGHSLGGQMGAMFAAQFSHLIDGLVLNASCSVYHKGWGKILGSGLIGFATFCKALSHALGYYPGNRVGFGGVEARGIIDDWHTTTLSGKFIAKNSTNDYEAAMTQFSKPVLGITYDGDRSAPPLALSFLLQKFRNSDVQNHHIEASGRKLNHYSWIKEPELCTSLLINWLQKV